jgi:hypothetical protein
LDIDIHFTGSTLDCQIGCYYPISLGVPPIFFPPAFGAAMTHIDEPRLESDLGYRFGYLAEFIGFDQEDIAAIAS